MLGVTISCTRPGRHKPIHSTIHSIVKTLVD